MAPQAPPGSVLDTARPLCAGHIPRAAYAVSPRLACCARATFREPPAPFHTTRRAAAAEHVVA